MIRPVIWLRGGAWCLASPRIGHLTDVGRHTRVSTYVMRVHLGKCPESTPERKVRSSVGRLLAKNPKGSVLIQVDQKSKNGLFSKVMDQAGLAAGAKEIAIAASERAS